MKFSLICVFSTIIIFRNQKQDLKKMTGTKFVKIVPVFKMKLNLILIKICEFCSQFIKNFYEKYAKNLIIKILNSNLFY